jgi:sigma-E factor negative regulatory protein RseB
MKSARGLSGFIMLLSLLPFAAAADTPRDLLMRMNEAANTLNYDGIFLHLDGQKIDTLRLIHRHHDGVSHERLYALNGIPREVIRDARRVWCFMPESKTGHTGLRSKKDTGFPGFMVRNLEGLEENYSFSVESEGRIADRQVKRLQILPRDTYRYGYELWSDKETGLLLKSVMIDSRGNSIEQYMFAQIRIGMDIPDEALLPMTSKEDLEWIEDTQPPTIATASESGWSFKSLPKGYKLVSVMKKMDPMKSNPVQHIILSDGLAGVSVFIEESDDFESMGKDSMEEMGAVHAYTTSMHGETVTVIGEVPAITVKSIGDALVRQQ